MADPNISPNAIGLTIDPPLRTNFDIDRLADGSLELSPGAIVIGGITLYDDEHPKDLAIGIMQVTASHTVSGGGKVNQKFGPQHKDISWEGMFYDTRVRERVDDFYALAAAGRQTTLTCLWKAWDIDVVEFDADIQDEFLASYKITVSVIADRSGAYSASAPTSTGAQVQMLSQNAIDVANSLLDAENAAATAAATAALPGLPTLAVPAQSGAPTALTLQAAVSAVVTAASVAGAMARGNASNQGLATLTQIALTTASAYATAQSAAGAPSSRVADAATLVNYLALVLRNVQHGQSERSITLAGANFNELAVMVYRNIALGPALARANGSNSTRLSAGDTRTIIFPTNLGA